MIIEKFRRGYPALSDALNKKGFIAKSVPRVGEARELLSRSNPDVVILDAASLQTSGSRLARRISSFLNGVPFILVALKNSGYHPNGAYADVLIQPFTIRKLANRIRRVLPGDDGDYLLVGPIRLNTTTRRVICNGRETNLTPRCSEVLQILMQQTGQVVKRKTLMKRVWRTDYMGDTRTLDVHINWIRKAIEENPARPNILKTIRGVGFRLEDIK